MSGRVSLTELERLLGPNPQRYAFNVKGAEVAALVRIARAAQDVDKAPGGHDKGSITARVRAHEALRAALEAVE